jgi:two-component system response regulator AtoC
VARILIVEDEENLRYSIRQALTRAGHEAAEADGVPTAWTLTRETEFDAVLTDISLKGESGIDLIRRLREEGYSGSVVVMTAYGSIENAVAAMKLGADDYLQKPLSLEGLVLLLDRLLEQRRVRRRLSLYERLESTRAEPTGMIGSSRAWTETVRLAERMATAAPSPRGGSGATNPTILLVGETGTGKGVLARHIHEHGRRASKQNGESPLVHVNCSALPPSLIESELFGHEKGAFTDAKSQRPGLFEMAEGGTIFLDEIGDMPPDLQAKILTVVEEGRYRRVGGTRDLAVSARIIAATNQDLEKRVEEGRFRRDLLYRLNALTVRIPPLRERGDDAPLLAESMLDRFAREYGRSVPRLTPAARHALRSHPWPGNVRELINMCQRVAMLCDADQVGPEELGLVPGAPEPDYGFEPHGNGRLTFDFVDGTHKASDVERELIVQALAFTRGNVSRAAKLIGMQRSSFRYRIERYGLGALPQEIARR